MKAITIVQVISTVWSKKSRGAPGSILRNSVPEAIKLPLDNRLRVNHELFEHSLTFHEYEGFDNPREKISTGEKLDPEEIRKYGCALVQKQEGGLRVNWEYEPRDAGMPIRVAKSKDFFELKLNQWGRVVYNGRFVDDEWWYEKTVVNIGLFQNPTANVFADAAPQMTIDKMALLS